MGLNCTEGGTVIVIRDCKENTLNCASPAQYRAKDSIAGPSLGAGVHLLSVLLVCKDNGDEFGSGKQRRIGMYDYEFPGGSEHEVSEGDSFGATRDGREGVLARPHGKEESTDDDVCGVIILIGPDLPSVSKLEESTEKTWSDGFLSSWWRVHIVECFQERAEGWPKLGSVLDVNGAPLETTPERRSQVACGSAQS